MPYHRYRRVDPRRYTVHAEVILGRRGLILALLGAIWVFTGVAAFLVPDSPSYLLLSDFSPWRGLAWIATGGVAIIYAAHPQGDDAPGFLALYLMPAWRIAAYGYGFIAWAIPGGHDGNPRGIVGVLAWSAIISMIIVIAGWRENTDEDAPGAAA